MAIDPSESDAAGDVGRESASRQEEIVTQADGDAVVEIFRAAKDRLYHGQDVKLIVASEKPLAVDRTETPSRRDELRANLVAVWIADNAEHIGCLGRHLETGRVRIIERKVRRDAIPGRPRERHTERDEKKWKEDPKNFH